MPTVLVVDDAAVDRKLVGGLLSKAEDLGVEYAASGAEALKIMEAIWPAIVVTDLIMPGMSGLELVQQIVERYPRVPVVLMTGKGPGGTPGRALRGGGARHGPKSAP